MGFAVVAEEVRSLAQRSGLSARETAEKIENSVEKSAHGVAISEKVARSLDEILAKARQVNSLVGDIATASHEQTQGIAQLNTAVPAMDKLPQENAASAEESASAAQQLTSQTHTQKRSAESLLRLVGAKNRSNAGQPAEPVAIPHGASGRSKTVTAASLANEFR
ncbi:MAG: methyl-accepting chemotaxis protein [Opitutus sp.]